MIYTLIKIYMLSVLLLSCAYAGKGSWEAQQLRAEAISADYQQRYPNLCSDRHVFKVVELADGSKLELDLRLVRPKEGGPFPVVFFVHGGAWATGSKAQFTHESYVLADHGIAGVRMEYRWKSHGAKYQEAFSDLMDSIDYIRKRADALKIDFSRVGLAGGSAGGHLSAIAAQLTPECISYDGYNGLYDAFDRGHSSFGGGDYTGETEAEKKKASAIYNIKENPPHTFLYHGTEDLTVSIEVARRFRDAIRDQGGHAEILAYEGAGHAFFNKNPYQTATTSALLAHTRYVFGLTNLELNLPDFQLPPAVAKGMKGFDLIGEWRLEGDSAKTLNFNADYSLKSTARKAERWERRYGAYYIIWDSGHQSLIEPIDPTAFQIKGTLYKKIDE